MPSRKRTSAADLFRRTAAEWKRIQGHDRGIPGLVAIPAVGIGLLIRYGALSPAEEAIIRAVHAGEAQHEHLDNPARLAHYMDGLTGVDERNAAEHH